MFLKKKFKEWWNIITFKKDIKQLLKEPPELTKTIFSLLLTIFIFSFLFSLYNSFKDKFMIGSLVFNTVKDTFYYSINFILLALLIYLVLRYIFKKQVSASNFLSPFVKIDIAVFGVITYVFIWLTIILLIILAITLLFVFITRDTSLLISLLMFGLNLLFLFTVAILLAIILVVISIILQVKIIKNVFNIGWFAGLLILIICGIIVGLLVSPINKLEIPNSINEIIINYKGLYTKSGEFITDEIIHNEKRIYGQIIGKGTDIDPIIGRNGALAFCNEKGFETVISFDSEECSNYGDNPYFYRNGWVMYGGGCDPRYGLLSYVKCG